MSKDTIRVGIVGARDIVTLKAEPAPAPFGRTITISHVAALDLVPRADLVAICRLNPALHNQFEKDWSARWPEAKLYTDYSEMLTRESLDLLCVATPDDYHAQITVDAAEAGVKGIFCEKPLATSLDDADRMIEACEANGTALTVDHTRRWNPVHHKVRDVVRTGTVGALSTIVANLGGERAMLVRNGTHMIDTVCFFAESEPARVLAHLEDGYEDWDEYKGDGGVESDSEPGATGYVLFRNGVRALYNGTKTTMYDFSLDLIGPRGRIHVTDSGALLTTTDSDSGEAVTRHLVSERYQDRDLVAAWQELIDVVEQGSTSVSSAREARKTLQIIFGFLRSHRDGSRLVDVPE